ncbi:MAG: hypothetical protein Q9224_003001 [Gallowayella concinna]
MAGPGAVPVKLVEDLDDMVFVSDDDNNSTDESDVEPVEPGMIPGIKSLYPGMKDDRGQYIATDKRPEDLPEPEETEESGRYALAIRYSRCYDGRKTLTISSIVVQSPLLKKVLCRVLKDYPGMAPELNRLEFVSPLRPFVHRWERLTDALNNEQDPTTKSHIQLFYDALKTDLELPLETRRDFVDHRTITFNALWMIFSPGDIVITNCNGRQIAARLVAGFVDQSRHEDVYHLECEMIHTDGEIFGWTKHPFDIQEFGGMRKISDLSVFPLKFHRNVEKITRKLIDNGKAYEKLLGVHHKYYQGLALDGRHLFHVDGRIILDTKLHNWHNPGRVIEEPLKKLGASESYDDSTVIDDSESDTSSDEDRDLPNFTAKAKKAVPVPALTEEQLMLCGSLVKGYSLRNKRWLDFFVDTVQDIKWKENVRDGVVLEEEQKNLIFSMTQGHRQNHQGLQTKGLNILVCGPTGVGKTFTVESVAENLRAPLFYLTAADVDLDPSNPDLESPFTDLLEMCGKWNAILLYDETSGSLDSDRLDKDDDSEYSCKPLPMPANPKQLRSLTNDHRLVLLRALESHSTAFFVTCNAFAEDRMDDRILSRFHVTFNLPELTAATREKIWQKCLESHKDTSFFVDRKSLAGWPLNGREIVNAVTVAKTLATDGTLEMKHLEQVVPASKRPVIRVSTENLCALPTPDKKKKKAKKPVVNDEIKILEDDAGPSGTKKIKEVKSRESPTEPSATTQLAMNRELIKDSLPPSSPPPPPPPVKLDSPGSWDSGCIPIDMSNADDGWGSFGTTKKTKKSRKAAVKELVESILEPPPAPEFDDCSDNWAVKKEKVSKNSKSSEVVESSSSAAAPAKPTSPPEVVRSDDRWGGWGFGSLDKKPWKKNKDAMTAECARDMWVPAESAGPALEATEPVLPAVEVGDWDFWGTTSKKTKKGKKKAAGVSLDEAPAELHVPRLPTNSPREEGFAKGFRWE